MNTRDVILGALDCVTVDASAQAAQLATEIAEALENHGYTIVKAADPLGLFEKDPDD